MTCLAQNGKFRSVHDFRCPECRQNFTAGTEYIVYHGPTIDSGQYAGEATGWWGCVPCAGIYADLAQKPHGDA